MEILHTKKQQKLFNFQQQKLGKCSIHNVQMEILQKKTSKNFQFYQNKMEKKKENACFFSLKFQKMFVFFC